MLTVATADVAALPEPSANPGKITSHGAEDSDSPLTAKLRRAWDRIAGNYEAERKGRPGGRPSRTN